MPLTIVSALLGLLLPLGAIAAVDVSSLDGECFALRDSNGRHVVRSTLGTYSTSSGSATQPFRLQKTGSDTYLLYGTSEDFMSMGLGATNTEFLLQNSVASPRSNWRLRPSGSDGVTISSVTTGENIVLTPFVRTLRLSTSSGQRFQLIPLTSCAATPEAEINVSGDPTSGTDPSTGEVLGLAELHGHLTAFEYMGGDMHCGRPWSPLGITDALADCPDHGPGGVSAWFENLVGGAYTLTHDTTAWPTFRDFPAHNQVTHEGSYYKWLERSWRAGLRVYTNLFTNNEELCEIYPIKHNSCNDMENVRLQAQRTYELQEFLDEQAGGPGKGWFRVVDSPAQARSVIEQGKLAVSLGVEVSNPFGCGIVDGTPQCTEADIGAGLDEMFSLGVRRLFLCHKFDNALCGVRYQGGTQGGAEGLLINIGNRRSTGKFWQAEDCAGPANDGSLAPTMSNQATVLNTLLGLIPNLLPEGAQIPAYPEGPQCNPLGLSALGEYALRGLMARGMMVEIDHMSVKATERTLEILEEDNYAGVVSGHSWIDPSYYARIYALGGVAVPMARNTTWFYNEWKSMKSAASAAPSEFGFGFGFDFGGLGSQPEPRSGGPSEVSYPFSSFDGSQQVDRQRTGERVFDVNVDGVAHYGLVPDWLEDLRIVAGADGQDLVDDMARGAEAVLQTWERVA